MKKQHRKEENIGKKKINLAGLGIAHQAIVQQAIALETKVKHHFSEEKKKGKQCRELVPMVTSLQIASDL